MGNSGSDKPEKTCNRRENHLISIGRKRNFGYLIIGMLLIIILVSNLIIALWFNNKLNKINGNIQSKISLIDDDKKFFDYEGLRDYQENYDSTKQYFSYTKQDLQKQDTVLKDDNGIALTKYKDESRYNPVTISQYGLKQYSNYIETGDNQYYDKAKIQADYLINVQDKETGKFYYDYDFKVSGTNQTLKAPWSSAMAQGQVISLLVRIYSVSGDKKYIEASKLAMKPLTISVQDGGLKADFFGYDYYEEYPTIPESYTLNGFMFTLIGLYDLYNVTGDTQAQELYNKGIETLEYCLPFYDSTGISLYHLAHLTDRNLPLHYSESYHTIHIIQLKTLDQIENNSTFKYYINRWEGYVKENS